MSQLNRGALGIQRVILCYQSKAEIQVFNLDVKNLRSTLQELLEMDEILPPKAFPQQVTLT